MSFNMRFKYYSFLVAGIIIIFFSCISDFEEQKLTLSTHNIDFGETKTEEIVTINYNSNEMVSFSVDVDLMEHNWVSISSKSGKFTSSYDLHILIDRALMPEGEASAKVNVKVGDVIKSIYITASHPTEVEITPSSLTFEPGIDKLKLEIRSRVGGKTLVLSNESSWLELSADTITVPRYNEDKSNETTIVVDVTALKDNLGVGEYSSNIQVKELDGSFEQTIPVLLVKDGSEYLQKAVDNIRFSLNDFQVIGDLIRVNFSFQNMSSKTISFLPSFNSAYDYDGNCGKTSLNELSLKSGNTSYSYYNNLLEAIPLEGGDTATGTFDISGINVDTPILQYIEITSNLSSPFIFRDIILPGKEAKPSKTLDSPHYENDGLKIQIIDAVESGNETIITYALMSNKTIPEVKLNLDNIIAKDNNDITYRALNSSFKTTLYSNEFSLSVPGDVYITGTVSFPIIESISRSITEIQFTLEKDDTLKNIVIDNLNLINREGLASDYKKIATFDYFDLYLVGCYADADDIVLDYLIRNTKTTSRILEYNLYFSYIIDDTGDIHKIKSATFTNGEKYSTEVAIDGNCASRGIIRISGVDSEASTLQYILLNCRIDGNFSEEADLIMNSRIVISGRKTYTIPASEITYNISQLPDKIQMELTNISQTDGCAKVHFRITNLSSGTQKVNWNLYSTASYSIDGENEKHYITTAAISYYNVDHSYFNFDLPGYVMVRGNFIIPDIDGYTKYLDRILLDYYDGKRYEFTNINW